MRLSRVCIVVGAVACVDAPTAAHKPAEIIAIGSTARVEVSLVVRGTEEGGDRVAVHLKSTKGDVGSFQGVVRYDPAQMEFVRGGQAGADFVAINPATPGLLRIAGFSARGVNDTDVAEFVFHPLSATGLASLSVDLPVIGDAEAARVSNFTIQPVASSLRSAAWGAKP